MDVLRSLAKGEMASANEKPVLPLIDVSVLTEASMHFLSAFIQSCARGTLVILPLEPCACFHGYECHLVAGINAGFNTSQRRTNI